MNGCINELEGFCVSDLEFAVNHCQYRGEDGECTARPEDLVEIDEDCFYCDGVPEFEDGVELCPVDYPEECPYNLHLSTQKRRQRSELY